MAEAPSFWDHTSGPGSAPLRRTLLTPVSWLYQTGAALRAATSSARKVRAPVVCVGNVTLGGTGKTPVAIAILRHLREKGVNAHGLSRGYRGRKSGPLQVDPDKHDYRDVGDEPLLLARVDAIITFPEDADSREGLLALADQAMFHIKQTGKGAIGVAPPSSF